MRSSELSSACKCILAANFVNNLDPDQTAPLGAVGSRFIVFERIHDKSSLG